LASEPWTRDDTGDQLQAGLAFHRQGRFAEAERAYKAVLARDPGNPDALHLMGVLAIVAGRPDMAVDLISRALQAHPGHPGMLANRAAAYAALNAHAEALADWDQVLAADPRAAGAHQGRGIALTALGRFDEAAEAFTATAALNPASKAAHFNLGNVLRSLGRVDEAVAAYDGALGLDPEFAIAHHNRAFCVLQRGDLAAGFAEYEWRSRCPTFDDPRYGLPRPWDGTTELAGRTLFVFPELFQGDMLQFCRYALMAERRGAHVRLAAPAAMHRLLASLSPTIELLPEDAAPDDYDVQAPLMSLPHLFRTTLESLPGEVGYLHAEPERVARWRTRIGEGGFRIGVVWQGSTSPYALPLQRSYPLAMLQRIGALPGVRLISLQKVNGLEQLASLPSGMAVETLGDDFDPGPDAFLDTAAAIACCDLVITMDTSVAHLAGALGARTWVALPLVADWRWLMGRSDSPWYPSATLFRQRERGDWSAVFEDMAAELAAELG
jgi:tetratricopeptide (TPR) repeat protein